MYALVALLAVAVLGLAGWGISGLLRRQAEARSDLTQKIAEPQPGLLKVEREPRGGVIRQEAPPAKTEMPADVRAWLEHLERIEKQRRQLALGQIGAFSVSLTQMQFAGASDLLKDLMGGDPGGALSEEPAPENNPASRFHEEVLKARADWRELTDEFLRVPPPPVCLPLKQQYEVALRETSGMMLDLMGSLERAIQSNSDEEKRAVVSELYKMKGASESIDRAGRESDALLGEICAKFETRKWFEIAGDIGGGGLLRGF